MDLKRESSRLEQRTLVLSVNGMLVLVICLYAFINGIEGLRAGGSEVDAAWLTINFTADPRWA
jgi:predicted Co/Zn/Cd cation transporter (cation efflux family)